MKLAASRAWRRARTPPGVREPQVEGSDGPSLECRPPWATGTSVGSPASPMTWTVEVRAILDGRSPRDSGAREHPSRRGRCGSSASSEKGRRGRMAADREIGPSCRSAPERPRSSAPTLTAIAGVRTAPAELLQEKKRSTLTETPREADQPGRHRQRPLRQIDPG